MDGEEEKKRQQQQELIFSRGSKLSRTPVKSVQAPGELTETSSTPLGAVQAPQAGTSMAQSHGSSLSGMDSTETFVDAPTSDDHSEPQRSSTPLDGREAVLAGGCKSMSAYKRRKREDNIKRRREDFERSGLEHSLCEASIKDDAVPDLYREMHQVLQRVRTLKTLTEAQTDHTKEEIERNIDVLLGIALGYCERADRLREEKAKITSKEMSTQTSPKMVEASTQVELSSLLQADAKEQRVEEAKELRKKIADAERNPAQLAQLLTGLWPREALTKTKLVRASRPLEATGPSSCEKMT